MNNGNQPATAIQFTTVNYKGLTKREHIATQILAGLMGNPNVVNWSDIVRSSTDVESLTRNYAIKNADSLLEELDKSEA